MTVVHVQYVCNKGNCHAHVNKLDFASIWQNFTSLKLD